MQKRIITIGFILFTFCCFFAQTKHEISIKGMKELAYNQPPEWAKSAIWYQIFVERFYNGNPNNNPSKETIKNAWPHNIPDSWQISDWTSDWYEQTVWEKEISPDFYTSVHSRRYGGDLEGVMKKLTYLKDLGITAIYFNPLNDAPSMHKYDARNYHHIDINFGPDPKGDLELIAKENPVDPSTWQWTSADKLFLSLIEACHKIGIRIILDYSWNHTGTSFWAWQDILENQENSIYKDWYLIDSFKSETTDFKYIGWNGVNELPEFKKINPIDRRTGHPYSGNLPEKVKQHIFAVSKRWLAPNGDTTKGVDGYRLDVADQIPMEFWREYRQYVRTVQPEAFLVGEIWWEQWPDKLMDPRPYLGDIFDAVMHYQQYAPARDFFAKTEHYAGAEKMQTALQKTQSCIPNYTQQSMLAMNGSHDAPRLLTDFSNKYPYKYHASPKERPTIYTGPPSVESMQRARLYLVHQYTFLGAPIIWNGDEMGMWGGDDPDCRKPLWWQEFQFEKESNHPASTTKETKFTVGFNPSQHSYYKKLIAMRKAHSALSTGELDYIYAQDDLFIYERYNTDEKIVVILNNANDPITLTGISTSRSGIDLLSDKPILLNNATIVPALSAFVVKLN